MNDFDYDCMQKKRIARGAFAHISWKRGGCTLPSDLLTAKQRKEKNGEVKSYNISRPMPWCEFKQMPDDLKREFYRNMQSFGGSAKWLAEEMGASDQTIRDSAERCGAPFRRGGRNLEMWQRKLAEWAHAEEKAEGLAETAKDETHAGWGGAETACAGACAHGVQLLRPFIRSGDIPASYRPHRRENLG